MIKRQILALVLCFCMANTKAQLFDAHVLESFVDTVYDANIRTVLCYTSAGEGTLPMLPVGKSNSSLVLKFDDLNPQYRNLYYTFIHCTSNWQATNTPVNDYLLAFTELPIQIRKPAFNTLLPYMHYGNTIPETGFLPTLSGNYLLVVFDMDNDKLPVLTRRIMLYDNKVAVDYTLNRTPDVSLRDQKQKIDVMVDYLQLSVQNAFSQIAVVTLQNNNFTTAYRCQTPLFMNNTILDYSAQTDNIFDGGNEYRIADLRTTRFKTQRMAEIVTTEKPTLVYLLNDGSKSKSRYTTDIDNNGKYFIRRQEAPGAEDLSADYINVNFSFVSDKFSKNMYIMGAFSDYKCLPQYQLIYDNATRRYTGTYLLKQGIYNYQYILSDPATNISEIYPTEGSYFETENDYTILVYYKDLRLRYEQLVAVKQFNTRR